MRSIRYALSAAVVALSGCAVVGPDYRIPDAAIVNAPAAAGPLLGATEAGVSAEPAASHWWALYDEPLLDDLVRQTLAANTARAQAAVAIAEDGTLPSTKIDSAFDYGELSGEQYLLTTPLPSTGLYDTGVSVSYQIDLFGQIKRGIEASRADAEAAQAAADLVRVTVVADTVRAYLAACSAGRELAVAQNTLALQERSADLTRRLVDAGRGSALDLTRTEAQVEQFRANIPPLQAEKRLALYRLATLTGQPPANFPRALEDCAAEPRLRQPIPVGDGSALLRRRPDIREAERQLAAATARIGVATADLYPKISFGLSGGSTGLIGDIFKAATLRYAVGPLISWDFPQQTADRARIRAAEARTEEALANFDGKVLAALREIESGLTVYGRDLDRTAALRAARDRADEADRQARTLFSAGQGDAFVTLDAERVRAGAEQALAQSESRIAADQVALFLALGGGWRNDAATQ
jgi:NodT family efflux transporter outer membrane factor (OMF) lipoprotein